MKPHVAAAAADANLRRRDAEAQRQRALVAAILAPRAATHATAELGLAETAERAARGLAAYRANADALAERALGAIFGQVREMVGAADFERLAAEFWRACPTGRGDLAECGGDFPGWLARHPALARWPYLADCARLERAIHDNERAADAHFDAESLARLGDTEPAALRIELMPGSALVESRWPIATIRAAHRSGDDADFAAARAAIERATQTSDTETSERVLVIREGWRADAVRLDQAEARWCAALLQGRSLADALDIATTAGGFDFAEWLARAVARRWLRAVIGIAA